MAALLATMMFTGLRKRDAAAAAADDDDEDAEALLPTDGPTAGNVKKTKKKHRFTKTNQPKRTAAPSTPVTTTDTAPAAATKPASASRTHWGNPIAHEGTHCAHNMCVHKGSGMARVPHDRRIAILVATGYAELDARKVSARHMCREHLTTDALPGSYARAAHVLSPARDPIIMADSTNPLSQRRNEAGDGEHVKQMRAADDRTPPRATITARSAAAPLEGDAAKISDLVREVLRLNRVVANLQVQGDRREAPSNPSRWWSGRVAASTEPCVYTYEWLISEDADDPLRCSEYTSLDIVGYKYWIEVRTYCARTLHSPLTHTIPRTLFHARARTRSTRSSHTCTSSYIFNHRRAPLFIQTLIHAPPVKAHHSRSPNTAHNTACARTVMCIPPTSHPSTDHTCSSAICIRWRRCRVQRRYSSK